MTSYYTPIRDKSSDIFKDLKLSPGSTWADILHFWYALLQKLGDPATRPLLLSHLSAPQSTCLLVLEEWWHYWCDTAIKQAISSLTADNSRLPLDPTHITCIPQRKLYTLWVWEFSYIYHTLGLSQGDAVSASQAYIRRSAVEAAAVHRTALSVFSTVPNGVSHSNSVSESVIAQNMERRLEHHIEASVEHCPWILKSHGSNQYPYYLWDKLERCTVHFEDDVPEYTVISHTWGRFRIPGAEEVLPNVPWRVPCLDSNLLFDIQALPEILSRFPIQTRYIWFDLVCIPQDGRPLQNIEIGRQAGIFKAARFASVWLNQVNDWDGLRSAISWSSLEYLRQYQNDIYGVTDKLRSVAIDADQELGLTRPAKRQDEGSPESPWVFENSRKQIVTPDRWFTSLWTLQEACLRPDMILCNKHWEIFGLKTRDDQIPILLDHIIALFSRAHGPRATDSPAAVHELKLILGSSNMSVLLTMEPVDILGLGQMRYCANTDRAIAIMSALGITDWYSFKATTAVETHPSELVGGQYPLAFLREFHRRFGAIMFFTLDVLNLQESFYEASSLDDADLKCFRGSMMPFSKEMREPKFMDNYMIFRTDHHAVNEWMIQLDGSVKVPKACIMAASKDQGYKPRPATILPHTSKREMVDDLWSWMKSFRPDTEKYAICLMRNMTTTYRGVIIERIDAQKNQFINVGTFSTEKNNNDDQVSYSDFDFGASAEVDWIVI